MSLCGLECVEQPGSSYTHPCVSPAGLCLERHWNLPLIFAGVPPQASVLLSDPLAMPLPRVGSYLLQAFLETWPISTFTESITLFDASAVVSSWDTREHRLSSDCQNHKLFLNMSRPQMNMSAFPYNMWLFHIGVGCSFPFSLGWFKDCPWPETLLSLKFSICTQHKHLVLGIREMLR